MSDAVDVDALGQSIEFLEAELEKLRAMKRFVEKSESGCPSCDFAVASSMVVNCIPVDEEEASRRRMQFLKGEITFRDLLEDMDKESEGCRHIADFINERFDGVMDTFFTDWVDDGEREEE